MNTEPHRTPEPPGGRERALVEEAWRQAAQALQAEQAVGSAGGGPAGEAFAGPRPDSFTGYKIIRELHRGGQGVVYQAIQESTQRKVAIKVMREGPFAGAADRARFDREVHVLGQLNHPHIVAIHDTGSAAGHLYFVMDYIPGQPLDVYMAGAEHTVEETLRLFAKICEAVNAAHLRGVIHRDLKPSNIRVDPDGAPHILDFGLAKVATPLSPPLPGGDAGGAASMTVTGQFVGSLPWASPEQAEGQPAKIDVRTDVYSLGVILYQMLTSRFPYAVIGPMRDVLDNILTAEPVRPSALGAAAGLRGGRINDEVDTIVLKCLQKERDRRYQTAGEVARDVGHYLHGEPIEAKRDSAGYVLRKHLVRYKLPVAVAAGFLVVITAGLVTSLTLWRQASTERDRAVYAEQEQSRERERAENALKLAEQHQREAQQVADFQSSMLADTDVEGMGVALVDEFERRIREVVSKQIEDQGELDRIMHDWRQQTLKAGPTNVALGVLDEFVLAKATKTIERDFADQPLVRAALQQTAAETYCEIGLHEPALALQEAALQTRREQLGGDHASTLVSIGSMGNLLHEMGKHEAALPYHREALEGFRRVLGDDHPDTLTSINNMGMLLQSMGKLGEADLHLREALEGRRRVLGEDHPDALESMNNMGFLLNSMGRWPDAEPYYRAVLETRRRVLGDDHPFTLLSINNMGALLTEMGRYVEAEPYVSEALEGRRRVLGENHPHTLQTINNMGFVLQSLGKLADAEPYYREALEGNRRVLGDDHPQTLMSLNNTGYLLTGMGKLAEAEPYHREALERRRRVLGDEHHHTLASLHNLGDTLRDLGRLEEAEALGAELVRGASRSLPEGHAYTGIFLTNYGKTLAALQRYAQGETTLLEAYGILERAFGPQHQASIRVTQSLVELYAAWHAAEPGQGHDAQAAEWRAKLEAWQASTQPAATQETATSTPVAPAAER
ncbi:MAG: serine/threonine-protein kinase [Planctomycetota bacterium]